MYDHINIYCHIRIAMLYQTHLPPLVSPRSRQSPTQRSMSLRFSHDANLEAEETVY